MNKISWSSRSQLPEILNSLGLTGAGAEIGVQRGHHARQILDAWKGERLYCVDSWTADGINHTQAAHESCYEEAKLTLAHFVDRAVIMRMPSLMAAQAIPRGSLDFVYIDADHSYNSVRDDISCWWPRVKSGGILAGHDWVLEGAHMPDHPFETVPDGTPGSHMFGVRRAVMEFCKERCLEYSTTDRTTDEGWQSWAVVKP